MTASNVADVTINFSSGLLSTAYTEEARQHAEHSVNKTLSRPHSAVHTLRTQCILLHVCIVEPGEWTHIRIYYGVQDLYTTLRT